jgi:hypothetical protein
MEILNFFAPTCQFLLSCISHINHLAADSESLLVASSINGPDGHAVKSRSLLRGDTTGAKAPLASSRPISTQAAAIVVDANGSTIGTELWSPTFDETLKNAIGHSLKEQNVVIQEILDVEPRLSRAAVVGRFVRRLLNYASNSNLERRESAIRQILELQPALDREVVVAKLNHMALANLPAWVNSSFWGREIDPVLLIGIRNAHQEFEAVVGRITSLYPTLLLSHIKERHAHYRSKKPKADLMIGESGWSPDADRMLREAIALESKTEREAILRVSRLHKELRLGAIQQRMRMLQRRFTAAQQYQRFVWSEELDQQLLEASKNNNLPQVVASIATEHDRSREIVYKHCERLGIPRQPRKPVRRRNEADLQYLMDHVNHQATPKIAEALGRSYSSVVRKIQQFGLSTAVSKYSLRDLRRDLHVHHSTIVRWIAEGKLKVALKKRKVKRGHQQHIQEEDLLEFLEKYHQELNTTKLEPHIRLAIQDVLTRDSAGCDPRDEGA